MTALAERLAAADKAVSGDAAPNGGDNYYLNKAKSGLATGIGNVADVIPRSLSLLKAGYGFLKPGFNPPEVDTEFANFNTNALKRLLGVKDIKAPSDGAEIVGGAIEGAASMPLPMGGAGGVLRQMLTSTAVGGAAGGGAAAGGQAATAIAPDSAGGRLAGELIGGVVGGVVLPSAGGLVGLASRARQAANNAQNNPAVQDAARTTAEKIIDRQVKDAVSGTPNAAENITEALRLRDRIPGFNPSVAEMADSPGLSEMQRRYSLTSPQRLNEEVARDKANAEAVRAFYEQYSGAAAKPGAIRSAINQDLADTTDALSGKARAQAGRLPVADQMQIGDRAAELARAEKNAARPAITAAYEKAFEASGDARVDLAPVIARAEEILGTKLAQIKPETAPQTVAAIQRLGGTNAEISGGTLRDIDAIRKAINADVASAGRSMDPVASTRMRNLSQMHEAIDEAVAVSKVPENAKMLYASAIEKYRDEFAPRFKEGANLKMFRDTSLNEPRIMADKFVAEYFKPDTQGGMTRGENFKRLFGQNAEAKELTKTGILDTYRQKVVNPETGEINIAAHSRFLRDHARTLDSFKAAGVNAKDELFAIGHEAQKIGAMQEKLSSLSKSLKFDTTDDLVNGALSSPKVMGNVLVRIGPNRESLQRVLMDKAWESGTGAGMQKFLTDNNKTLRMALSPQHLENMTDISKALAITERAPVRGALASGGPDILKNATGVSMATVWAQYRATSAGRQGPMTATFNLAAPVMTRLSQTNFNDVMQKALHDPETAKALRNFLMTSGQGPSTAAAQNLLQRIGSTAKMAAGIVWDYKGNAVKLLSGVENYGLNAGRSANAISTSVQADQP